MIKRIGIDAGGTFIKIAYEDNNRLHVKSYSSDHINKVVQWLNFLASDAEKVITGGRAGEISGLLSNVLTIVSEFDSTSFGTKYLLHSEIKKSINRFLIVSVGTGTSILLCEDQKNTRITGSGIGGATFMGLGSIFTGESSFETLVQLAGEGNRLSTDFLVSDIYSQEPTIIEGTLTAANFGKAYGNPQIDKEDLMASLVNMIAETLCLLVSSVAKQHHVNDIVFIGGTLEGNKPLQTLISKYQEMLGLDTHFLTLGSYAGAIGALYQE